MILSALGTFLKILFGWSPEANVGARETAWLDGVRGVAAFLVMLNHYDMEWLSAFVDAPFGATVLQDRNPDGVHYHRAGDRLWAVWRLPIFKILMISGGAQVAVFFVLSGMVLSWSPIGSIQAGNYEKLYTSLGSSVIRRWFRLFLPCMFVSSLYLFNSIIHDWQGILPALSAIWEYILYTEHWANPFETVHVTQFSTGNTYNFVMWTIPFEFAGSVFVYVSLLGFGKIQSCRRRVVAVLLVSWYAFFKLHWCYWLFGHGIAISDYVRYSGGFKKISQRGTWLSSLLWTALLLGGLILMGYSSPSEWFTTPGYEWTQVLPLPDGWRFLIGEQRAWWGIGGICVILSCSHLTVARRFFELAFIQYLGKISFMLYLIHFLINSMVALPLRIALYNSFCVKEWDDGFDSDIYHSGPIFNIGVHILLWIVTGTTTFIVSSFLERFVDRPCTAFGKWMDDKLTNGIKLREKRVAVEEEELLLEAPDAFVIEMEDIDRRP